MFNFHISPLIYSVNVKLAEFEIKLEHLPYHMLFVVHIFELNKPLTFLLN